MQFSFYHEHKSALQYPWYFAFGIKPAALCPGEPLVRCEGSSRLCPALGDAPLPQGLQARAPLSSTSCCRAGDFQQAALSLETVPSPAGFPAVLSSGVLRAPCCSSCSKVVPAAGGTFLPCPRLGLLLAQRQLPALGGKGVLGMAKLKGKVLHKKTQPPACFYTGNGLSVVVFFLLVSVLIKNHKAEEL